MYNKTRRIRTTWTSLMGLAFTAQLDVHQSTLPANDFHCKLPLHLSHYPLLSLVI